MNPINEYQYALHALLRDFLDGYTGTIPTRLFPIMNRHRNGFIMLRRLVSQINSGDSGIKLEKSSKLLKIHSKKYLSKKNYALLLCELYKEFYSNLKPKKTNKTIVNTFYEDPDTWMKKVKQDPFLRPLEIIVRKIKKLKRFYHGFYVHGSMSTLDYVKGFSDVDSIVFLKKEVLEDSKILLEYRRELMKIQKYMFKIDSTQHHGFGAIAEQELSYYPQIFFPFTLFKYSIPVVNSKELIFYERDCENEKKEFFLKLASYFKKVHENKIILRNQWQWHLFFAYILIIPTRFLQIQNPHSYKRDSFKKLKAEVIDEASKVRKKWPQEKGLTKLFLHFLTLFNNPNVPLIMGYLKPFKLISEREKAYFKKEAYLLVEKLIKQIK